MLAADIAALPTYDSEINSLPPCYSSVPVCGEQSIQLTPRTGRRLTGTFVHKAGKTTVALLEQEEGVTVPVYGRQSVINGIIGLNSSETFSEVKIKLHGHMEVAIIGASSHTTTLVDYEHTIWKYDVKAANAECPSELPFACVFPLTFKDRIGREAPLPPSMHTSYPGATGLNASCVYKLTVKIIKGRGRTLLTQIKKLTIPIKYHPRNRPHTYLNPHPDLFSDIKISPEEWHQTMGTIRSRKPAVVAPVQCHLFIPSVKVFGLSDTIHFHVQLSGKLASLRQLVYSKPSKSEPLGKYTPKIRVYLLRQISVDVCGQKGWKNVPLAEGELSPRPPPFNTPSNGMEDSLDWDGTIQCNKDLSHDVPGFTAGDLTIKDFIVLSVSPADPSKSDLVVTQVPVMIKLVTESAETWMED